MYPVVFTLLSCEISKPILDGLLDGLEQPTWVLYGKSDFWELWFDCGISNPPIILGPYNVSTNSLSMYFDIEFKWIDTIHMEGSCTNFLHRDKVISCVSTVVV
jgi:hypothetical protein